MNAPRLGAVPERAARLPPTLVRLAPPAPGGTLVLLPDMGGSVFYARALVGEMGGRVGCVGARLDARLLADLDRLTIPDLGRRLAEDVARASLPGPLHLAGFSFAGFVAFEAARRLAALGVPVQALWLFDVEVLRKAPGFSRWRAPLAEARRAVGFARRNWRTLLGGRPDPDALHAYGNVPMYLAEHPEGVREIIRGLYRALVAYRPAPWPALPAPRAVLVRGTLERRHRGVPPDLGWLRLVPSCEVVDVPGRHLGLMTDPGAVARVAGAMHERLGAGDTNARTAP